jgi:hypothetical protein
MAKEPPGKSEIVLFQTEDGRTRIEVQFQGETAWLSLNQMAELFQRDKSVVSKHIKNIFEERELLAPATVAKFATAQSEGDRTVSREIEFYNLDVIISVGYRVKSHRGTQFRIWATQRLREFIVGIPTCGLKARIMTAQGKRSETSAALGHGGQKNSSPERAAQFSCATGFGNKPVLVRPFRAGNIAGRLTQGVARGLALPWAVMLWRFQRRGEMGGYPIQTSENRKLDAAATCKEHLQVGREGIARLREYIVGIQTRELKARNLTAPAPPSRCAVSFR